MDLTHLAQQLADMHVSTIVWVVVVLTAIRLAFVRVPNTLARAVVEVAEAALFAAVLVFLIIQPFLIKAFYIPSGSMMPTLIDDDHILVNKFSYRFEPKRHGDIVVFTAPPQALKIAPEGPADNGDPTDYIKRLIGLPGDLITVVGGKIQVGNRVFTHGDVRHVYSLDDSDNQHVKFTKTGVEIYDGSWSFHPAEEVAEKLTGLGGQKVLISPGAVIRNGERLDEPYIAEDPDYDMKIVQGKVLLRDADPEVGVKVNGLDVSDDRQEVAMMNAPPEPIPAGEIIVMGDNRNDSNDGSRWGPLDEHNIVGRAFFIFYPFKRIGAIH